MGHGRTRAARVRHVWRHTHPPPNARSLRRRGPRQRTRRAPKWRVRRHPGPRLRRPHRRGAALGARPGDEPRKCTQRRTFVSCRPLLQLGNAAAHAPVFPLPSSDSLLLYVFTYVVYAHISPDSPPLFDGVYGSRRSCTHALSGAHHGIRIHPHAHTHTHKIGRAHV